MKTTIYRTAFAGVLISLIFMFPDFTVAQETDTTRQEVNIEAKKQPLDLNLDRTISGGKMTDMGSYQVPEEKEYYTPPFKGQKYLDIAVEAYRKQLEERIGPDWLWKFMKTVSPFINNQFEFGYYQIYDLPIVERDNALFQSNENDKKRQ